METEWMDFVVAMTVAILGGTGISGIVNLSKRSKNSEVLPAEVNKASQNSIRDEETEKLRNRLDEFWEMHSELRAEVQKLRADMNLTTAERDSAQADTRVVHGHVLELRDLLPDGPPWPPDYPPYLKKD